MALRAFLKSSLTAGTSSQRSSASPAGARSPSSQPNVTSPKVLERDEAFRGAVETHEEDRGIGRHDDRRLFHEDPFRLQQRERDETDDRSGGDEEGIADFVTEENHETAKRDERGEPVADGDLAQ